MRNIFNKIFRDDLDLNKYWWHRAFKVSFLIILITSFIITGHLTRCKNGWHSKPYFKSYYEVVTTLSNYISKHSDKSLVKLEKILVDGAVVVDKERYQEEYYKIGDIILDERNYNYHIPSWIISDGFSNMDGFKNMECKDGMTIEDVKKYKSSKYHYDTRYYSRETEQCEVFPNSDYLFDQVIRKNLQTPSNCIISRNNCMYTVGKNSEFIGQFLVAEKTEKAIKYANDLHHKEMVEYYKKQSKALGITILETLGVTSGIALLILLLYYKGFVYIVYGSKKE